MKEVIEEKLHWYCFTYATGSGHASTYTGYPEQGVTMKMIKENKINAGIPQNVDAVLLACVHLGHMTKSQFTAV